MVKAVQRNIVTRSRNVSTSKFILNAWYRFSRRERFCGEFMSPETKEYKWAFMESARYLCPISTESGISPQIFVSVPSFAEIHPVGSTLEQYMRQTRRRADRQEERKRLTWRS